MKRILIIGSSGSGKSTIAKKIGEILSFPFVSLDQCYWQPGWKSPEKSGWRKKVLELIKTDRWILEGNYKSTLDIIAPATDAIIFLDINRSVCLWRVFKRRILKDRIDKLNNCEEKVSLKLIRNILLEYPQERKPRALELLKKHSNKKIIIIKSNKDIKKLLEKYQGAKLHL
ncbi:MAG: topology modulation protein [Patescibacteria group bacterium]